ncbi:DUF6572 domain-containing protein [Dyella sp. 2HG41-7]|uniref:DUF6572 domain-containing protein n=1 Tax=Dyella sp. 2HG41-7 TaxID=2883239 RepID=UPI001F27DBF4|nr:DUF6572 domain-containing protein [Dyella sp. 2HG41-7]
MSVEESNIVDAILTDSEGFVILAISDHLSWSDDPRKHMWLLQEKINGYLVFLESDEILESYPDYRGRSAKIRVVGKYPLSGDASAFYMKMSPIILEAGFGLEFRLLAEGEGS